MPHLMPNHHHQHHVVLATHEDKHFSSHHCCISSATWYTFHHQVETHTEKCAHNYCGYDNVTCDMSYKNIMSVTKILQDEIKSARTT